MEHKMVNYRIEDGKIIVDFDTNKDGEPVGGVFIHMTEAAEEGVQGLFKLFGKDPEKAIKRFDMTGKIVSIEIKEGKVWLTIDSNKDGEPSGGVWLSMTEAADEFFAGFLNWFKKDDEEKSDSTVDESSKTEK